MALPNQSNRCLSFPAGVHISQRNTPALFGSKLIDEIPERVILASAKAEQAKWGMAPADGEELPVGRAPRLASGRIGRFGWKGQTASLSDFVQAACANLIRRSVAIQHTRTQPVIMVSEHRESGMTTAPHLQKQPTGLIAAPFCIVVPFRVCSPAAVRKTAYRGRRS